MGHVIRTEFGQVFEDDDDFEIEVSDLRTGAVSGRDAWRLSNGRGIYTDPIDAPTGTPEEGLTADARPHRSPFAPYLTRRQRARRAAVSLGVVVAAFLAITLTFAPFLYAGLRSTAAQPLPHGADRFYFVPSVPWGIVELDGNGLVHPPEPGSDHPLHLTRGTHTLQWLADPFIPFQCTISVPRASSDTCATQPLLDSSGAFIGTLITEHDSLRSLHVDKRLPLKTAIQTAMRGASWSTTIQPGEHYLHPFMPGDQQSGQVTVADRTLTATMHVVPALQTALSEPCSINPAQSELLPLCRAPGQDCRELCTLSPPKGALTRPDDWFAAITARTSWTYSTPDGNVTMQDVPSYGYDLTLVVLRITWTGTEWQVTPLIGDRAHLAAASDVSCGNARAWLIDGVEENQLKSDVPTIISGFYSSSANAATGCAVTLPVGSYTSSSFPTSPPQTELPVFLWRFGALLAVNDAAHALWPALPVAIPHERMVAEALSYGWA